MKFLLLLFLFIQPDTTQIDTTRFVHRINWHEILQKQIQTRDTCNRVHENLDKIIEQLKEKKDEKILE